MSSEFFAPTLQPDHAVAAAGARVLLDAGRVHASSVNVTLTSVRVDLEAERGGRGAERGELRRGLRVAAAGWRRASSAARAIPSARPPSTSSRSACGQPRSNTRGSASSDTFALISDVPPSPQPGEHADVVADVEREERARIAVRARRACSPAVASPRLRERVRVVAGQDLAAAFEHAHRSARRARGATRPPTRRTRSRRPPRRSGRRGPRVATRSVPTSCLSPSPTGPCPARSPTAIASAISAATIARPDPIVVVDVQRLLDAQVEHLVALVHEHRGAPALQPVPLALVRVDELGDARARTRPGRPPCARAPRVSVVPSW